MLVCNAYRYADLAYHMWHSIACRTLGCHHIRYRKPARLARQTEHTASRGVPRERSDARGLVRVCSSGSKGHSCRNWHTVCDCWPHAVCDTHLVVVVALGIAYRNGLRCRTLSVCGMLHFGMLPTRAYARG